MSVRCPQYSAPEVRFAGCTIGNAVNTCRFCGHRYEVTMMMGNYLRSFRCKCCRGKKRKYPKLTEVLITASPCARCGCGSYCHWNDLHTPGLKEPAAMWAESAKGLPCQRCPKCKGGYLRQTK